jgi:hypothetical protein
LRCGVKSARGILSSTGWSTRSCAGTPIPKEIRPEISRMIGSTPPSASRSARVRPVFAALLPQPISNPTPDGETQPSYAIPPPIGWLYPGWWSAQRTPNAASPAAMQRSSCFRLRSSTGPNVLILLIGLLAPLLPWRPIDAHSASQSF